MERLKRSLSFRKKKDHVPESSKPHQWQEDEKKVRDGTCSFQVRYLGCIEVFESRGIQTCEEAVKALKAQCKGKYQRAILYVSGDALRVVDEINKGLIMDQTIEKVSFCAPDRNHEKGFAYICRDGTTRRWMCHGFLALKESGERLSHAVGCAFAICLEKKQKREKDSVQVTFNQKGTSFTRTGSFRQTTLTERIADPQSAIIAEPIPEVLESNPFAVDRPKASDAMLVRQGSFRGFEKLNESSPFKRQLSLRLNDLPSTLERQGALTKQQSLNGPVSPIPEASPTKEQQDAILSDMCQQITQGLSALTTDDPFARVPGKPAGHAVHPPNTVVAQAAVHHSAPIAKPTIQPIQQNNPWDPNASSKISDAEFWLHSAASNIAAQPKGPDYPGSTNAGAANMNGTSASPVPASTAPLQFHPAQRAPHLTHIRSHSVDTADVSSWNNQNKNPTLRNLNQRQQPIPQFQSQHNGVVSTNPWSSPPPAAAPPSDPFEQAWATKPVNKPSTNPFQSGDNVTKAFEVKL